MGRSPCCEKNGVKKGPWTPEEDQKLTHYIQTHGYGNWRTLPKNAGLQRCGKSCRLRWTNYLRPDIKRGRFSFEEEETIIHLHSILGNKWSLIAAQLPGRTDNEIKNFWNTHIRKRLMRMGIDPVTHSPRLDLLDLSTILNASQMNFSRLYGTQPFVNPELIRLATSLFSSQNQNQESQIQNHLISTQYPNPQVQMQDSIFEAQNQLVQDNFGLGMVNDHYGSMPSTVSEDNYVPLANYGYCSTIGSGQYEVDPGLSSEASTFQSNGTGNNLSYGSVLSNISTPSSSPAQLNDTLKYEIPDFLDVSDYYM